MVSRVLSFVFGLLSGLAGLVALSYTLGGIEDLKFFKGEWLGGALGVLVPGVLSASAFYMSVHFLKADLHDQNRRWLRIQFA